MYFKTPLAFAIVGATSAFLMTLFGGAILLGAYRMLAYFVVVPSGAHSNVFSLGLLALAVFALTLPIEMVYARRTLLSRDAPPRPKSTLLFFPVAVAVAWFRQLPDRYNVL